MESNDTGTGALQENGIYYFHPDHLGSTSYLTNKQGNVSQHVEYIPFGEIMIENHLNNQNNPYLYNGKELDAETGFYYYGARYYEPKSSLWLSVDPLAEKMPDFSAYAYAFNNPVMFVDPTGMQGESTHIDDKGKVVAVYDDGDNGVYQHGKNADGGTVTSFQIKKRYDKHGTSANGKKVGETLSPYSFIGDDGQVIIGAEINLNDQSGQNFFNNEIKNVGLFEYMNNATGREPLDFKTRDMPKKLTNEAEDQYVYRGMPFEGKIASARDIGNYAAGYVSGVHGFGWGASRFAFDALQTRQDKGTWNTVLWYPFNRVREGQPTQQAQRAGHNVGYPIFKQRQFQREWSRATTPFPIGPKW